MRRDVFQAIADPNRRAILSLLANQRMTLNGVAEKAEPTAPDAPQAPPVSKEEAENIKKQLEEAGAKVTLK